MKLNRRRFLKIIGTILVSTILPNPSVSTPKPIPAIADPFSQKGLIGWKMCYVHRILNDSFIPLVITENA